MTRTRLGTLIAGLAIVASACGGAATVNDSDSTTGDTATPADDTLFSPTEIDQPFDLNGGVASSSEGVSVVSDDPRGDLDQDVFGVTGDWPTDWTRRTIDPGELFLGIAVFDPRDRIPPIDVPRFEPIEAATWLDEREPGALVTIDGETRFYPLSILTRHEIVNDRFGDVPVVVTFCPLCNTAIAFDARVDGEALRFGVSGLLRNSDLVMWDSATTSLWQQITGEAVVGELAGTQLDFIPTAIVSYGDAVANHPDAVSLSRDTGFPIDYGANAYVEYSSRSAPISGFFTGDPDPRFPALSRVVGVTIEGENKAFPFAVIEDERAVNDEVGGTPIVVLWGGDTADALDARSIASSDAIGTGIAFDRRVDDQVLTFSSVGDDQFADAETESTWTLLGRAVDGPLAGTQLETVTHRNEFWFAWARFFPDAPVYGT